MGIMTPMWCFLQFSRELPTDFVQIWSESVTLLCPARSGQHSLVHKLESSGQKIKENHSPLQQSVDTRAQLFFLRVFQFFSKRRRSTNKKRMFMLNQFMGGCLLGGVYAPCIYRMPGGVIVSDSGLCCCGPVQFATSIVRAQLLPTVCWFNHWEKQTHWKITCEKLHVSLTKNSNNTKRQNWKRKVHV